MVARTLTIAICLAAALAASANAAHAGFVKNTARLASEVVRSEKLILTAPLSAGQRLKLQGKLAVGATKCFIKAATSKPCI